jgi:hypothetical protein
LLSDKKQQGRSNSRMYGSSTQEISSIAGSRQNASKDLVRRPRNERRCAARVAFDAVIDLRFIDSSNSYNPLKPRKIIWVIGELRSA